MSNANETRFDAATCELVITRFINAPRTLVWKAWTDPAHLARWWGPKSFTAPVIKMDVRPGGKYHWCMMDAGGMKYWTAGEFLEVVPPARLVYTDSFADEHGNKVSPSFYGMQGDWSEPMVVTITFEDAGSQTKMILRHSGLPEGELKEMTGAGWNEQFDKLDDSLV
jgi:uncharacterized protein YndB with AHSA1/START domain